MNVYVYYAIIGFVIAVYAINYVHYLTLRSKNYDLLKNAKQVTKLNYFRDSNNFVTSDHFAMAKSLYPNKGFLPYCLFPFYPPAGIFGTHWKIKGKQGFTTTDLYTNYLHYNETIGRIILPPLFKKYVMLIEPESSKKTKIETGYKSRGGCGGYVSDDLETVFLISPIVHRAEKEPQYKCTCLNVVMGKHETFDLPGRSFNVWRGKDGVYFAIVINRLYRIQNSVATLEKTFKDELRFAGRWSNENFIFHYHENDLPRLEWRDVVLKFTHPRLLIEKAGDYLWVVDFDGEYYVLKTFNIDGNSSLVCRLEQKPYEIGNWQNAGIWLDYPDGSVEVYNQNGLMQKTKLDFTIGFSTVDVDDLKTVGL